MEGISATNPHGRLSGFALKRIAVVSMLLDHFGSIVMDGVLAPYMQDGVLTFTADMPFFVRCSPLIKSICEALGSVAFPLFCFLLAEGFAHTHNRARYAGLLGAFALLSEVPFNLAHFGRPFCFDLQNVLFTLLLGVCAMAAVRAVVRRGLARWLTWALGVLAAAAIAALAYLLRCEYVFLGIASILLFCLLREHRYLRLLGVLPLLVASPWALLTLVPLFFYSGARGKGWKYFFYVFYPAHFLVFWGIAALLAGRTV